jgi:putative GTP pyrophosphokinase
MVGGRCSTHTGRTTYEEVTMAIDDACHQTSELPSETASTASTSEVVRFVSPYQLAISELSARFGILRDELTHPDRGCPIEQVSSRVKSFDRIAAKARRLGCPLTPEWMRRTILDIAGVRVVCGVISDTYRVATLIGAQPDVTVLVFEDYIAKPKLNGYRGLHMTIEIPVLMPDRVEQVPVELQIRTRAMDIWASFEHRFRYRDHRLVSTRLVDELTEAADAAHRLDMAIERLHNASGSQTA